MRSQTDKAYQIVSATLHKLGSSNNNPHLSHKKSFAPGTLLTRRGSCTNPTLARERPLTLLLHHGNPSLNPGSSSVLAFDVLLALQARHQPSHLMQRPSEEQHKKERRFFHPCSARSRTTHLPPARPVLQALPTANNHLATLRQHDHPARPDMDRLPSQQRHLCLPLRTQHRLPTRSSLHSRQQSLPKT